LLLNIKPGESGVVKRLFLVQFFLGIATAFLFTGSLTLFLHAYPQRLPEVFIYSAFLLFLFNVFYGKLEAKISAVKLLEIVLVFSALSILCFWLAQKYLSFYWLPLLLAGWYVLLYMLVNYSFWGMASLLFNVRESKRVVSIISAGDIPGKMLGYFSVSVIIPFIPSNNLLWVSVLSFFIAFLLLQRFKRRGFGKDKLFAVFQETHKEARVTPTKENYLIKLFQHRLVLFVALLCLLSYCIFAFIDFTFLTEIKVKYQGNKLTSFIAIFFAIGQLFAIIVKVLFSGRMIARIGLANSLLIAPLLLLIIDAFIIYSGNSSIVLYVFGAMALLEEILRSTLQEPVFFILFQPLSPHDRSRGHLFAEGYTMPFALFAVGSFLIIYLKSNPELPMSFVTQILMVFLLLWIATVFLIRKAYLEMLLNSLKKGYFKGTELFLNDDAVIQLLLRKTESNKPMEVINALNLLERSNYSDIYKLLMKFLQSPVPEIKEYVLSRIINNNMTIALPFIKQHMQTNTDPVLLPKLIKTLFYLDNIPLDRQHSEMLVLNKSERKAAMVGLLTRRELKTEEMVIEELIKMAGSSDREEKILVTEVIMETQQADFFEVLKILIDDTDPVIFKKAIEATGKVREFRLFSQILGIASIHKAYPALQKAILYYGDEIFAEGYWHSVSMDKQLMVTVIKTAGKVKGKNSTSFLIQLLKNDGKYSDLIIDSIWKQKAKLSKEEVELMAFVSHQKLEHSRIKVLYYKHLTASKSLKLLEEAISLEIQNDLWILLKVGALIFDRQKVDRVIELLELGDPSKISNAIEVLELILPNTYFIQLNTLIELLEDIRKKQVSFINGKDLSVHDIIEDVLQENKANFSEWTKSIACYMLPKLTRNEFSLNILNSNVSKEDHLFNETRDYVLLMLK